MIHLKDLPLNTHKDTIKILADVTQHIEKQKTKIKAAQ